MRANRLDGVLAWAQKWWAFLGVVAGTAIFIYNAVTWAQHYVEGKTDLIVSVVCHHVDPAIMIFESAAEMKAAYEQVKGDPNRYPTYLLEVEIVNTPEVEGVRVRVAGLKRTMPWSLFSNAFPRDAYDTTKFPNPFPPEPEGVLLPTLPTLGPRSVTKFRTVATSDERDLCSTEWVTVTASKPALEPLLAREQAVTMSMVTIRGPWLPLGASLLVVVLALVYRFRKRLEAAGRALFSSPPAPPGIPS